MPKKKNSKNSKVKGKAISEDLLVEDTLLTEVVSQEEVAAFLAQSSTENQEPVTVMVNETVEEETSATSSTTEETSTSSTTEETSAAPSTTEETSAASSKQLKLDDAKIFLHQFMTYLSSHQYENDLTQLAIQYNIPKKRLAQNFIGRIFGVISDVFGVVVETTRYTVKTIIGFIAYLLQTGTDLICNFALGIGRIFTFNQGA